MPTVANYRFRLRAMIGTMLNSEEICLTILLNDREVTIKSQEKDQPLSKNKWLIFSSGEFQSEADAWTFGNELRCKLDVAAICSRLGIDTGQDITTSGIGEGFARSIQAVVPNLRLLGTIHGLVTFPDDGQTHFLRANGELIVHADPSQLLGALAELANQPTALSALTASSSRLINLALINSEPYAQMVLAFAAVEALGQSEQWSESQKSLLKKLSSEVKNSDIHNTEYAEVASALDRGMSRIGLRQGVIRVLSSLNLLHLRTEWDRIYRLRSGLFHGTKNLSKSQIHQLAFDSIRLCVQIVLAIIAQEGLKLPTVVNLYYPADGSSS